MIYYLLPNIEVDAEAQNLKAMLVAGMKVGEISIIAIAFVSVKWVLLFLEEVRKKGEDRRMEER